MQSGPKGSVGGETGFRVPAIVLCALALCVTLGVLFHRSFEPGVVHFANDFPVGNAMAHQYSMAEGVTGYWMDLNWLGQGGGVATPGMNSLLQIVLGPIGYSKFIQPAVALPTSHTPSEAVASAWATSMAVPCPNSAGDIQNM